MSGRAEPRLTGRHVLVITLAGFGVIVGVNLTMAVLASGTFPGLVVENSYVASQKFDGRRERLAALGWTVHLSYEDGEIRAAVADGNGRPVGGLTADLTVGRPAAAATDRTVVLSPAGSGLYAAQADLAPGRWQVVMRLDDGTGPVEIAGPLIVEGAS